MRINLNHWVAVSIPRRGCCERRTDGVDFNNSVISSMRLRHLMMKLRASSLLILSVGNFASTLGGTFNLPGGKRPASITNQPQKFSFLLVGFAVPCVHLSIAMVEARVDCIICEYTSAYDQPPAGGVASNNSSGIVSSWFR